MGKRKHIYIGQLESLELFDWMVLPIYIAAFVLCLMLMLAREQDGILGFLQGFSGVAVVLTGFGSLFWIGRLWSVGFVQYYRMGKKAIADKEREVDLTHEFMEALEKRGVDSSAYCSLVKRCGESQEFERKVEACGGRESWLYWIDSCGGPEPLVSMLERCKGPKPVLIAPCCFSTHGGRCSDDQIQECEEIVSRHVAEGWTLAPLTDTRHKNSD